MSKTTNSFVQFIKANTAVAIILGAGILAVLTIAGALAFGGNKPATTATDKNGTKQQTSMDSTKDKGAKQDAKTDSAGAATDQVGQAGTAVANDSMSGMTQSTTSTNTNATGTGDVAVTNPTNIISADANQAPVSGTQVEAASANPSAPGNPATPASPTPAPATPPATPPTPVTPPVSPTPATPPVTPPASTTNLIANGSVEDSTDGLTPTSFTKDTYGVNIPTFTYVTNDGHTGTHSVKVEYPTYTVPATGDAGDAKWSTVAIPVTAGKSYQFTDYYKSTVATEIDAFDATTGAFLAVVGRPSAAGDWTQFKGQLDIPIVSTTTSIIFAHVIAAPGTLTTDDYALSLYTPVGFSRAMVSLTFDDGWKSIHDNALPLLQSHNFVSTQYLNSQPVVDGYPEYMSAQDIKDFYDHGDELGWHTQTHADLALPATNVDQELTVPQNFVDMLTAINVPVTTNSFRNFASPFGSYNANTITALQAKGFTSHRSVETGYNSKDNLNIYNIKVQNVVANTTTAQVQGWIDEAIATNTWLVIVYHEVTTTPLGNDGVTDPAQQYSTTPSDLATEFDYIQSKLTSIDVLTVKDALARAAQ